MKNNILLVVYSFPPIPGIGGRRWAKFAKYLAMAGYTVHVIRAPNITSKKSLWCDDIIHENIKVYEMPLLYPKIIQKIPTSIIGKIYYRFWRFLLKFLTKGTIYDPTIFWKNTFLKKSKWLIEKYNIKNVVITGGPFRLLFYGTKLKETFNINLICDFRDPWVWGSIYGFKNLSKKRLAYEKNLQDIVLEKADYICASSQNMVDYLKIHYKIYENKMYLIPHGYDKDDFGLLSQAVKKGNKLSFIYVGTVECSTVPHLEAIINTLSQLSANNPSLYQHLSIDFYVDSPQTKAKFEQANLNDVVKFHKMVSPKILFSYMRLCDFVFTFRAEEFKNDLSTKYFEILFTKKPIIYVGPEGVISKFLTTNGIGLHFDVSTFTEQFLTLISNPDKFRFNQDFDIDSYSYESLTKKFQKFLK